eukprot:2015091-Alexandrium_andersonii.AAC.1
MPREALGSVGSVPVVIGSVDRFGSIDIPLCSAGLPGGGGAPHSPDLPEKRLRRIRRPVSSADLAS